MKKLGKKLSLLTCTALLSSTLAFAQNSIDDAFKNGTVSGTATLYGIDKDAKGGTKDSNDFFATFLLGYETASYNGLSVKTSYIAGHGFDDSTLSKNSLMVEAYLKYAQEGFSVSAGRQAIDLEWLGDYNESIVAAITSVPDTTIVAGYVNEQAAADEDEIGDFSEVTKDGAYVLDAKYAGISNIELNPYYYSAKDVADFYGLKATYSSDSIGGVAHYTASSEETGKDGSIAHLEINSSISNLSLSAGYIKTDKDRGVGSISAYGDNISPFDEGANTYSANAKTFYGSLAYTVSGIDLGLLYGETEFSTNSEESELNLTAGYSITDSLNLSVLYVDYDLDGTKASDFNSTSATLAYSF